MNDKLVLIFLCIFAFIFGILHISNIQFTWSQPIMGYAALALGIVCGYRLLKS